jgi:hypothetical protein
MVPLDVRRELWAWYYGMRAFMHCQACCEHILKEKLDDPHPLFYPLSVGATINYGRPFRKSYGMPTLGEEIVPARYSVVHEMVMLIRDRLHAHTDADRTAYPGQITVDVLLGVTATHREFKLVEAIIKPKAFENLNGLCKILVDKTSYHMDKLYKRYQKELPIDIGEYRIGLDPNGPDFIKLPLRS